MKIAVVGAGHMGFWLAREFSEEHEVAVFDQDQRRLNRLPHATSLLSSLSEIGQQRPALLINAVSLQHTVSVFEAVSPYLTDDCLVCDVASIKGKIADYYESAGFDFISVHPMFGPTFANMNALREENAVIISESAQRGKELFGNFFQRLGCRIFQYSFEEHDKMMAYSLTTPFVSSMIFAACVDAKAVPGTTFKRHMAIARNLLSEDNHLLAEILFNPHSLARLEAITSRIEFLKHIIKAKDQQEATRFFQKLRTNIGESESP